MYGSSGLAGVRPVLTVQERSLMGTQTCTSSSCVASRCETLVAFLSDPHVRVGVLGPAEQSDDDVMLTVQI